MKAKLVWPEVARLRHELADVMEKLEPSCWDATSWCEGWRVRDVLGHLVYLAEARQSVVVRDVLRAGGRPDRMVDQTARRVGEEPVPELARRLRSAAGGRFHALGSPSAVALGEVIVHGGDALRPLNLGFEVPVGDVVPLLDLYRRVGRMVFHSSPVSGRRLVATDADWAQGSGPEVRGKAVDLLMLLANRRQVTSVLEGEGIRDDA